MFDFLVESQAQLLVAQLLSLLKMSVVVAKVLSQGAHLQVARCTHLCSLLARRARHSQSC